MARFMIVRGSDPLAEARVKIGGRKGTHKTDDEGRLEVELGDAAEGTTVELKVSHPSGTYRREVDVEAKSSLTVVNVGDQRDTGGEGPLHSTGSESFNSQGESLRDRYDVKGRLGSGGMGVVVKAYDTVLERIVAIKILSEELAEYEEARKIFMREVRSLATLSHPNLVAVYDVVENADRPLMITEYVNGMTLEQIIQSERVLPQSSVLQIAVQLSRAVEYLHSEDTVHRDIKPGNIMLKEDGSLKIIDFGLARSMKHLSDRDTRVRGTPAYMAPEQVQGDELSNAIDIYQIGVTLHEVASGQLPFQEGDVGYKHVHEEPPYLGDLVPNILPGLADLVHVCLSKDPEERPASASVLREEAERLHNLLTSSRVSRDEISKPNIGGASDSQLKASTSPGGPPTGSSPNIAGGSRPGLRESSPVRSSSPGVENAGSEESTSEAGKMDTELSFERNRRIGAIALVGLLVVGVGGYFAWRQFGGAGADSESPGTMEPSAAAEAPSNESNEQLESEGLAGANPDATGAPKVIPSASTEIAEAVVASKSAADSIESEGTKGGGSAAETSDPSSQTGASGSESGGRAADRTERAGTGAPSRSGTARAAGGTEDDDREPAETQPSEPETSPGSGSESEGTVASQGGSSDESTGASSDDSTGTAGEGPDTETSESSSETESEARETASAPSEVEPSEESSGSSESEKDDSVVVPMDSPGSEPSGTDREETTQKSASADSEPPEESSKEPAKEEESEEEESSGSVPMSF